MPEPAKATILEVGVDYITATSHSRVATSSLFDFGNWLVSEEVAKGHKRCPYRASGYRGWTAGGASYGISRQGSLIRCSSASARAYWEQCVALADNVTRLDLQVTIKSESTASSLIRRHYRQVKGGRSVRGRPPKYKLFTGPTGPESLYCGSRASDRMLRIYDKGLESGLPKYAGSLRYELELKRKVALEMARQLSEVERQDAAIAEYIYMFALARLIRVGYCLPNRAPAEVCPSAPIERGHVRPHVLTEDGALYKRVMWVHVCLKPTVKRFFDAGMGTEMLDALGLAGDNIRLADNPGQILGALRKVG